MLLSRVTIGFCLGSTETYQRGINLGGYFQFDPNYKKESESLFLNFSTFEGLKIVAHNLFLYDFLHFLQKFKVCIEVRNEKNLPVMIQMWQLSNIDKVYKDSDLEIKNTFQD